MEELKRRNYEIVPEIARELIKEQQKGNGKALPWENKNLYKEIMFDRSINSFEEIDKNANNEKPIFFDRGFLDTICYAELIESVKVAQQLLRQIKKCVKRTNITGMQL